MKKEMRFWILLPDIRMKKLFCAVQGKMKKLHIFW